MASDVMGQDVDSTLFSYIWDKEDRSRCDPVVFLPNLLWQQYSYD